MSYLTVSNAEKLLDVGRLDALNIENKKNIVSPENSNHEAFVDVLKKSVDEVNRLQLEADKQVTEFAVGENKNVNETMMAMEKANLSFRLMVQVRNKIIEAYQEIMRMQV